jgi:hypothetical protein
MKLLMSAEIIRLCPTSPFPQAYFWLCLDRSCSPTFLGAPFWWPFGVLPPPGSAPSLFSEGFALTFTSSTMDGCCLCGLLESKLLLWHCLFLGPQLIFEVLKGRSTSYSSWWFLLQNNVGFSVIMGGMVSCIWSWWVGGAVVLSS